MKETVSACLEPEQVAFLRGDGGISKNIRKAVKLLQRKRVFRVELKRTDHSGYAYFTLDASDMNDLLSQIQDLRKKIDAQEILKNTFWYLYEINEKKQEAHTT